MSRKKHKKKRKKKVSRKASSPSVATTNSCSPSPSKTKSKSKCLKNKLSKKPKDKHKPKQSRSSYFLFCDDVRASFKEKYPGKAMKHIVKLIATEWNAMTNEQQQPYRDHAAVLKTEYKQQLAQYEQTKHYKDYQHTLKQWKQTQHSKQRNKKSKTKNTKKRDRNKNKKRENDSESSLSSNLSDIDPVFNSRINRRRKADYKSDSSALSEDFGGIDFVKHLNSRKRRNIQHNTQDNDSESTTDRRAMTIADCILDKSFGIEMPSTLKERQKQREQDEDNDDNDNSNEEEEDKKEDLLQCKHCMRIFEELNSLNSHERKIHTKQCKYCSLKFRTETLLELHIWKSHDGENVLEQKDRMRVDERGHFKMNTLPPTQYRSRVQKKRRAILQMAEMKDRVVIDEESAVRNKRKREPITTHSFLKTKRSNLGHNQAWSAKDTKKFYDVLRGSGLNFIFMEVLYNEGMSNTIQYAKKEGVDDIVETSDSDAGSDKKKKKKKRVYRDAKALRKKYQQEERINSKRITDIVQNAKFTEELSNRITALVTKNEFKLKDEDYFEDSDDMDKEEEEEEIGDEDTFNPLKEYKHEIEEDKQCRREMKRMRDDELENWRKKDREQRQQNLRDFKKEADEYKKKSQSLNVDQCGEMNGNNGDINYIIEETPEMENVENVENVENTENDVNVQDEDMDMRDNDDGNDIASFDPFATLSDNDSDHDINGYDSDRSVTKHKQNGDINVMDRNRREYLNGKMEADMDDGYDEYDDAGMHDFDINSDPFE